MAWFRFLKTCSWLLACSFICSAQIYAGTSSIDIKDISTGQTVYEVHYEDPKGTGKTKPGVYVVTKKGSKQIVSGHIPNVSKYFNGIIAQLPITRSSRKSESLSIVDGKLTIFSKTSNAKKPASTTVVLGSKNHPIVDAVTGQKVELDEIKSVDDVEVYIKDAYRDSIVVVSVKQKSPFGDGITFALLVDTDSIDYKKGGVMQLHDTPYVIAHRFLKSAQLKKLVEIQDSHDYESDYEYRVYSINHLLSLSKPDAEDHPVLAEWKKQIAGFTTKLLKTRKPAKKGSKKAPPKRTRHAFFQVPTFILEHGRVEMNAFLTEPVTPKNEHFRFYQAVNPFTGAKGIFLEEDTMETDGLPTPEMQGAFNYDAAKNEYLLYEYNGVKSHLDSDVPSVLGYIDNQLYVFFKDYADKVARLKIGQLDPSVGPPKFSFVHHRIEETIQTERNLHYLIVSEEKRFSGTTHRITQCYVIRAVGRNLQLVHQFVVNGRYYTTKELEERLKVMEHKDESKSLVFDNITAQKGSKYRASKVLTTPYLDLTGTVRNKGRKTQLYLQPIVNKAIVPPYLKFRSFNPKGADSIQTGLYILDVDGEKISFVEGEPIPRDKAKKKFLLDKQTMVHRKSEYPTINVSVLAINPDPGRKRVRDFGAYIYVSPGSSTEKVRPISEVLPIDMPPERLVGAKILRGKRRHQEEVTILFFFKAAEGHGRAKYRNGGVFSVHYRVGYDLDRGRVSLNQTASRWLEKTEVPLETLKHRVVPDYHGNLYWVATPDKENTKRSFRVRKFSDPEKLLRPNNPGESIALKFEESFEDGFGRITGSVSDWLIYSKVDLVSRYDWLQDLLEQREKDRKEKKEVETEDTLFPQLERFLNHLAGTGAKTERQVLLVEPKLKKFFETAILAKLAENDKGNWNIYSKNFFFYAYDPQAPKEDMAKELRIIAKPKSKKRTDLLYGNMEGLLKINAPSEEPDGPEEDEYEDFEDEYENDEEGIKEDPVRRKKLKQSPFYYIVNDGETLAMGAYKKAKANRIPRIPMLFLATPDEWRQVQEENPKEAEAGVFEEFNVNTEFLTSSWTMWAPDTKRASKEIKKMHRAPISLDEHRVFPNLEKLLAEASKITDSASHRILIVPDDLKGLVKRLVLSRWATDSKRVSGPWNYQNDNVVAYKINQKRGEADEAFTQEIVFDNFGAMKGVDPSRQAVLLGELDDVMRIGRPTSANERSFQIRDPAVLARDEVLEADEAEEESISRVRNPHLLWLLANEGEQIQPKEYLKGKSKDKDVSILLFGTEKEWAALEQETAFENKFGLNENFEVIRLEAPSPEVKRNLIHGLFKRPEIRAIGYRFKVEGASAESAEDQLVSVLVSRVEQIAKQVGHEPTSAFIRTYSELRRSLIEDVKLRRGKEIDRFYIERLFARVFPMPLSLKVLAEDDPLRRIANPDQAAFDMQKAGYNGPLELKHRVVKNVLSQTRGADRSRPIPSSTILFGGTSSGKTFLFETLVGPKMLDLEMYDFDKPNNEEAGALIVRVANLTEEEDKSSPELLSVDECIKHINNFLSLPNGHRGFILFDDIHKARSTPVLQKLMTYIQSLFEAENGLVRTKRIGSDEVRETPVRNINLFMTLNPTKDQSLIERYVDESENSLVSHIIAALVREDFPLEESFFARWSDIINLDAFPVSAKVPTLITKLREASQQEFTSNPRLVLVSPEILNLVVSQFPKANAREFIQTATYALLDVKSDVQKAPAYLILPKPGATDTTLAIAEHDIDDSPAFASNAIEEFIRESTITKPVLPGDFNSQLDLLSFVMDGFRVHVFDSILQSAQTSKALAGTYQARNSFLAPFFLAVISNLSEKGKIPVSALNIKPDQFGALTDLQMDELHEAIRTKSKGIDKFFPFEFDSKTGFHTPSLGDFLGNGIVTPKSRGRLDVFSETAGEIETVLREMMAAYFRMPSLIEVPESSDWINQLNEVDSVAIMQKAGNKIGEIYLRFLKKFYDKDLREMVHGTDMPEVTTYDKARLFLMTIDKAISQLPWASTTKFVYSAIETATGNLGLGQQPAFQTFLFESGFTPLRTVTPDFIRQTITSSGAYQGLDDDLKKRLKRRFKENCENLIIPPKGRGQ